MTEVYCASVSGPLFTKHFLQLRQLLKHTEVCDFFSLKTKGKKMTSTIAVVNVSSSCTNHHLLCVVKVDSKARVPQMHVCAYTL